MNVRMNVLNKSNKKYPTMDLTGTGLSTLLNPTTKHYLKVGNLLQKLYDVTKFIKDEENKKLIVDCYDKLHLTSFNNKIYENLNVVHPLIRILVENINVISEIGDKSNYFLNLTSKLLKEVLDLIKEGINPTELRRALIELKSKAMRELTGNSGLKTVQLTKEELKKMISNEKAIDLAFEAMEITNVLEDVRFLKVNLGDYKDSYVFKGMIFNRAPESLIQSQCDTKTLVFNCSLDFIPTETKGVVLFENAQQLIDFDGTEESRLQEYFEQFKGHAMFCNGSVNEVFLDFLNKNEILVCKVLSKYDLIRLNRLLGGKINQSLNGAIETSLNTGNTGISSKIETFLEGNKKYTKIIGNGKIATVVIRDSLIVNCDEYEREVQLALKVIKNGKLVDLSEVGAILKEKVFKNDFDDQKRLIYKKFEDVFVNYEGNILKKVCIKSIGCCIDLINMLVNTDDYLMTQEPSLNIKPKDNPNWDD